MQWVFDRYRLFTTFFLLMPWCENVLEGCRKFVTQLFSHVNLSTSDILFGIYNVNNDKLLDIFNYVILWGKWYLSIVKLKDKQPSLSDFLIILKIKLKTEETFCYVNDKMDMFQDRWQPLYLAVEAGNT